MKCIYCQQEISDNSAFCSNCGKPQNAKKTFPITERAFCRIFKPSFFGGLELNSDDIYEFMLDFLSLSKPLSEDEIVSINHGFDSLLNNANKEYSLTNNHSNFILNKDEMAQIENEKFRYNFLSDSIFNKMNKFYKFHKSSGSSRTEYFGNVWLFSLLSALDGDFGDEKKMFFSRMKNLFPISRENFIKFQTSTYNVVLEKSRASFDYNKIFDTYFFKFWPGIKNITKIDQYSGDIEYETENGEKKTLNENTLAEQIPEDFDFYNIVEEKTKSLCELEYQIQELENSEGKYSEIADKIAELSRKELELLEYLPGFVYKKF